MERPEAPEAVVFDIGRVLIEWDPMKLYAPLLPPAECARLFAEADLPGMNAALDLGAPFRATVEARAARHPEWAPLIRLWHDRWIEMAQPAIAGSVRLLAALKARGVPVFALSNFGAGPFEVVLAHYPFLGSFDRAFLSGPAGMAKPDPRFYALLEAGTGIAPGRLLFVDDTAANVAAARARGWQAHLFETPEGWGAALVAAGLLSPEEAAP
jgi:2-haloacid dehalogenase